MGVSGPVRIQEQNRTERGAVPSRHRLRALRAHLRLVSANYETFNTRTRTQSYTPTPSGLFVHTHADHFSTRAPVLMLDAASLGVP